LIVCFCFFFWLCLFLFSFALYFWWMGSHQGPIVGPYLHIIVVATIYFLAHR
jgi:hypothetical protein